MSFECKNRKYPLDCQYSDRYWLSRCTLGYFMRHHFQGIMMYIVSWVKRQLEKIYKLKRVSRNSLKVPLNHHQESSSGYLIICSFCHKYSLKSLFLRKTSCCCCYLSFVGMDSWTYLDDGLGVVLRNLWRIFSVCRSFLTVLSPWRLYTASILTMKYPSVRWSAEILKRWHY